MPTPTACVRTVCGHRVSPEAERRARYPRAPLRRVRSTGWPRSRTGAPETPRPTRTGPPQPRYPRTTTQGPARDDPGHECQQLVGRRDFEIRAGDSDHDTGKPDQRRPQQDSRDGEGESREQQRPPYGNVSGDGDKTVAGRNVALPRSDPRVERGVPLDLAQQFPMLVGQFAPDPLQPGREALQAGHARTQLLPGPPRYPARLPHIQLLRHLHQRTIAMVHEVQGLRTDARLDLLGQRPYGRHGVLTVDILQTGAPERPPEAHGNRGTRPLLAGIGDPDRHNREAQLPVRRFLRLQRDACGPGAQFDDMGLRVTAALRIDLDRATTHQHTDRVAEHLVVAVHRVGVVLPAVHGDAPQCAEDGAQEELVEERRPRQGPREPLAAAKDEQRVDETVRDGSPRPAPGPPAGVVRGCPPGRKSRQRYPLRG